MQIASRILNALFPPKCPVCNALTEGNTARLCSDCARKLREEADILCPLCGKTAGDCLCLPQEIEEQCTKLNGRFHICAGFYNPGQTELASSRLIYTLKERTGDTSAQISSRMLAAPLLHHLLAAGEDPREWILVYPPRSARKKAEMGFDQAERLTHFLGQAIGAKKENVFHRRGGKEQKYLTEEQRHENIRKTVTLRHPHKCRGKKILLIDDILTSGATLSHCAGLLLEAGAEAVVCVTVLKTLPRKKPKKETSNGLFWFEE